MIWICVFLLVLIAIGVGYIIYRIEHKDTNNKSYVEKVNDVLENCPYPILFRNPECVAYKKWHCHFSFSTSSGKDVLVIDLD